MNKIILIFLENDDCDKEIDQKEFIRIKKFLRQRVKRGFEIRVFSDKNESIIKKWIEENAMEDIITNPNPFNSVETKIDENTLLYTVNDFSKIFQNKK